MRATVMSDHQDTVARLLAGLSVARERERRAETADERADAARTVALLEDDLRSLGAKREPVFSFRVERGSDAWQEGLSHVHIPASELTDEHWGMMSDSELAEAKAWLATEENASS